jgi:hypothetical protein
MVHGNSSEGLLDYISVFLEDIQLFLLFFRPEIDHVYYIPSGLLNTAVNYLELNMNTFTILLSLSCAAGIIYPLP